MMCFFVEGLKYSFQREGAKLQRPPRKTFLFLNPARSLHLCVSVLETRFRTSNQPALHLTS